MNEEQLNNLFAAARSESAPVPPPDFAADVLHAVRREPPSKLKEQFPVFDQLNLLFPRIALAAAAVVIFCLAADWGLTAAGLPDLGDGISQISAQWFLTPDGFLS